MCPSAARVIAGKLRQNNDGAEIAEEIVLSAKLGIFLGPRPVEDVLCPYRKSRVDLETSRVELSSSVICVVETGTERF